MRKVGFVRLGIVGRPMAGHLQAAGHALFLHSTGPLPRDLLDAGAVACRSGREVAAQADIIVLMVPDTPHVDAVLSGPNGVAEGLASGHGNWDRDAMARALELPADDEIGRPHA